MRKAVVRDSDGFVGNVIEIKERANWPVPEGCHLVDAEIGGSPRDTWDGTKFIRPEPIVLEPERDLAAEIDELKARVDRIGIS